MSKGPFEVPGTRALKIVFLCLRAQELRVASCAWGLCPHFWGPLSKEHHPCACIGCALHISLSNWGFVWPPVGGWLQKWGWKILERESKRGMKFKWKEDQANFTKKFLVPYGNVLRNFSSPRMIPSFLPTWTYPGYSLHASNLLISSGLLIFFKKNKNKNIVEISLNQKVIRKWSDFWRFQLPKVRQENSQNSYI